MHNEYSSLILLATGLPDGNHIFDAVWEKSALAAVLGLLALVGFGLAYLCFKQMNAQALTHQAQLQAKDTALAAANKLFQDQMKEAIVTTSDLVKKHEETNSSLSGLREDFDSLGSRMTNAMRAIGNKLEIPAERLKVD